MPEEKGARLLSVSSGHVPGSEETVSLVKLEDALHQLSQPLTALSMVLDMASFRTDAEGWRDALVTARTECRRAVVALHAVRSVAFPAASHALRSPRAQGERIR